MFSERAFFSFVDVTDPDNLPEYHDWQLYDHLPENRALTGVAWGERWARIAGAEEVETTTDHFAGVDSMTMYWFRPPYDESLAQWQQLGADSVQWGRGPAIPTVIRRFMGFFDPVKGYVAPHALVSPDVLPYRPNAGVQVTLSRYAEPLGEQAHLQYRWYDRERLPDLLAVPGVAGAWTYSFREGQNTALLSSDETQLTRHQARIRLLYLDDDPVETTRRIVEAEQKWAADGRGGPEGGEEVLFSAPLQAVIPFQPCPPAATAAPRG